MQIELPLLLLNHEKFGWFCFIYLVTLFYVTSNFHICRYLGENQLRRAIDSLFKIRADNIQV